MTPGKFVYEVMNLKNSQLPPPEFKSMMENHTDEVLNIVQSQNKLLEFLTSSTNNGFPLIFAIAYNCEVEYLAKVINRAKVLDPSAFSKIVSVKDKNDKSLMEALGERRASKLLEFLSESPLSSKSAPSSTKEVQLPSQVAPIEVKGGGRSGKASVLLDKNGTNFKFLPSPSEIRRIESGLSYNSIRFQDFQDFVIHQANNGEIDLPNKLSPSKGNKIVKEVVEQAKEILGIYKKGVNPTGLTPREILFLKRIERYCYVSPDGLLFSIKKYNWLRSKRGFKQIVSDLFK